MGDRASSELEAGLAKALAREGLPEPRKLVRLTGGATMESWWFEAVSQDGSTAAWKPGCPQRLPKKLLQGSGPPGASGPLGFRWESLLYIAYPIQSSLGLLNSKCPKRSDGRSCKVSLVFHDASHYRVTGILRRTLPQGTSSSKLSGAAAFVEIRPGRL